MINHFGLPESTTLAQAWIGKLKTVALDLLFPPHCVVCQCLGGWLCADCLNKIEALEPPVCQVCGLPQDGASQVAICARCQSSPFQLDGLRSYAFHGGPLRKAIHAFKYEDLRGLAAVLGKLMADGWLRLKPPDLALDTVVPVPLHSSRQRQRGYNQSALLAREFGACLRLPVVEDAVVRSRATAPQVDLDARARHANVRDAFQCKGNDLHGRSVLVIDDVCTSGATLEAVCLALRGAGVSSVWAYTLTRARPDAGSMHPPEK